MRKILAIILALSLIFSLGVISSAKEENDGCPPTCSSAYVDKDKLVVDKLRREVPDNFDQYSVNAYRGYFHFTFGGFKPEIVVPANEEFSVSEGETVIVSLQDFHWDPVDYPVQFGLWNPYTSTFYNYDFNSSDSKNVKDYAFSHLPAGRYCVYVINKGPGPLASGYLSYTWRTE